MFDRTIPDTIGAGVMDESRLDIYGEAEVTFVSFCAVS